MSDRPGIRPLGVGERFDEIAHYMAEAHRLRSEAFRATGRRLLRLLGFRPALADVPRGGVARDARA